MKACVVEALFRTSFCTKTSTRFCTECGLALKITSTKTRKQKCKTWPSKNLKNHKKKEFNVSCKKKIFENGNSNNNACETNAQFFFCLTMRLEIQSFLSCGAYECIWCSHTKDKKLVIASECIHRCTNGVPHTHTQNIYRSLQFSLSIYLFPDFFFSAN